MKKILATLTVLVLSTLYMMAVVAPKTPYQYKQPDGSLVTLVNHGDEFHSWTTMNGQVVKLGSDGFWRPAADQRAAKRASAQSKSMRQAANQMLMQARQSNIAIGEKPFLVVLVEFSDLSFTVENPNEAFSNMLNQEGYSANGGTGSARDYYVQNSNGQFKPSFDVYGPVKVNKEYSYYGKQSGSTNDEHPDEALYDACVLLDSQVDFSKYDIDNDGYVDNVFFYYAGHNQAEGGGDDTIWPHAWSLYRFNANFDGVRVYRYACTSEYKGSSGTTMCGIGTFCHEFGHVLGLPDFYDTDYEDNGDAHDMDYFDLMSSGPYLNEGRTPPYLTGLERIMLDWKKDYSKFQKGSNTLESVKNDVAYYTPATSDEKEYFVYEFRDGTGWDAYIPKGLLIYHVDQTDNYIDLWDSNDLNCYADHPCCYVVASSSYNNRNKMIFPGTDNVTKFIPTGWDGKELSVKLSDITVGSTSVSINVETDLKRTISGKVYDIDGNVLQGANVLVAPYVASVKQAAANKVSASGISRKDASYSVTTDSEGAYKVVLNDDDKAVKYEVTASKSGFVEKTIQVDVESYDVTLDLYLRPIGTVEDYVLSKYSDSPAVYNLGYNNNSSIMGGLPFTASEMAPYAGMRFTELNFYVGCASATNVYALIDINGQRVLWRKVDNPVYKGWTKMDISDAEIVIPANAKVVIGYAVEGPSDKPLAFDYNYKETGAFVYQSFSETATNWSDYSYGALMIAANVMGDMDPGTGETSLAIMGFNSIDNPKDGVYSAGDVFTFKLLEAYTNKPSNVVWFFDGTETSAANVTLTAGSHKVAAKLTFANGNTEEITLEISVN